MREIERIVRIKEDTMKRFNPLFFGSLVVLCLWFAGAPAVLADGVTITAKPNPAIAGKAVVFTIAPALTGRSSHARLDFGDNTPAIDFYWDYDWGWVGCGPGYVQAMCTTFSHVFLTQGRYTVSFVATGGTSLSAAVEVVVGFGMAMSDQFVYVPTAAHLTGFNGVNWRTDLEVQNPGSAPVTYSIALLARGQDNGNPVHTDFTLDPGQSVRYRDVLQSLFGFGGAASLCIVPTDGTIVATSRTYAESGLGTYGSFVPAAVRATAIPFGNDARLIGLSHDPSLAVGFRTNIGMVNANANAVTVEANFYLADGTLLGTASYDLQPFEFRQVDRPFEQFTRDPVEDGYALLRLTYGAQGQMLEQGTRLFAYAFVIDNITGDPTYIPAVETTSMAASAPVATGTDTWTSITGARALCDDFKKEVGSTYPLWLTMQSKGASVTLRLSHDGPPSNVPGAPPPAVFIGTRSGDAITASFTGPMGGFRCGGDTSWTWETGGTLTATISGNQITGEYTQIWGAGPSALTFLFDFRATFP